MALLKNGELVSDMWTVLDEDQNPLVVENPIITVESWKKNEVELKRQNKALGILLRSDQSPEEIRDSLDRFTLIALDFPVFSDGRGFSSARLLRERFSFDGELRAVGDVRRDQFLFLLRCGFDTFEIKDGSDIKKWKEAEKEVSVFYQPASDNSPWVLRRRHN